MSVTSNSTSQQQLVKMQSQTKPQRLPSTTAGGLTQQQPRTVETAVSDILYSFPEKKETKRHILSVLVDNEPGVLSKVAGLLSARGFNIESLSVSKTDVNDLSRMTVILNCPDAQMAQAHRQLEDLVNVWAVLELAPDQALERELLVCKLDCVPQDEEDPKHPDVLGRHSRRIAVSEIIKMFDGKVINVGTEHVVVEVVNTSKTIDSVLELLRPFGIIEAVRSGALAMSQSKVTGIYDDKLSTRVKQEIDESSLPPG
jgi:acetolactate synthase I/III small subunit